MLPLTQMRNWLSQNFFSERIVNVWNSLPANVHFSSLPIGLDNLLRMWSFRSFWSAMSYHYCTLVFRSTSPSRPNEVGLKCPSARPYVCPSIRPSTKRLFDFNEIWCVGIGRRYTWRYAVWPDPRSRSRSRAFESRKFVHFQTLSLPPFIMGAGKWPRIPK